MNPLPTLEPDMHSPSRPVRDGGAILPFRSLRSILGTILVLALTPWSVGAQAPAQGTVAVLGATLVDGTGRGPIPDAAVVIRDGRIVSVGPAGEVAIPDGARIVDAGGRWLLPGFVDTHAHLTMGPISLDASGPVPALSMGAAPDVPHRTLRLLLAHGITAARDPGGDARALVALREAVAHGALLGPRLRVAGKVIDRAPFPGLVTTVQTAEEVRAAVRADAEAGVDMVKLYASLDSTMLAAGVEEAHRLGVEAVAHLMLTTWTDAAQMGLDHILHILPGSQELLPGSRRGDFVQEMQRGTQFMYAWFELVDLDGPEIREMIRVLAREDVTVDPTLVLFEAMVRGDDPAVVESPELALAPPVLLEDWRTDFHFNLGWTPEDFRRARAAWPRFLELARRLHEAGVPLTAGSDANNPWIVPGTSFHRELELLVEAGIPAVDVVTIATRNGARAMGLEDEIGTVEVGKQADLVLLADDPLEDISNTRSVIWTMQAGRILDPASLLPPRAPEAGGTAPGREER